jgi:two-component system sensor histidine kinase ChiS
MGKEQRILVVDDDPIYVRSTRAVLQSQGYLVDIAQGGDEALAMMGQDRPDLVILDVMMDWVLEGVSISQEMMSRRELQRIPIIMVTSIRSSEHLGVFPQDQYLHINSWLDKPCSPDQLIAEVEKTLARHKELEEKSL